MWRLSPYPGSTPSGGRTSHLETVSADCINRTDAVVDVVGPLALPSTLQVMRDAVCAPLFESGAEFGAHYIQRYLTLVLSAAKQEDSGTRAEP